MIFVCLPTLARAGLGSVLVSMIETQPASLESSSATAIVEDAADFSLLSSAIRTLASMALSPSPRVLPVLVSQHDLSNALMGWMRKHQSSANVCHTYMFPTRLQKKKKLSVCTTILFSVHFLHVSHWIFVWTSLCLHHSDH
jgi:hypothetical protein